MEKLDHQVRVEDINDVVNMLRVIGFSHVAVGFIITKSDIQPDEVLYVLDYRDNEGNDHCKRFATWHDIWTWVGRLIVDNL